MSDYSNFVIASYAIFLLCLGWLFVSTTLPFLKFKKTKKLSQKSSGKNR